LNDNPDLDDDGISGIAQALKKSSLAKIGLARCNVSTDGCLLIADALRSNHHLKYLNLDGNGKAKYIYLKKKEWKKKKSK
jgi:hypothetical protein